MSTIPGIRANNVSLTLSSGRILLKDVTFAALPGECMGVVGPNGAGKSSLLKLIAGMYKPTNGSISKSGDIAYMGQRPGDDRPLTMEDYLFSVAPRSIDNMRRSIRRLERCLDSASTDTMERYSQLLYDYAEAGGYNIEADMSAVTQQVLGSSLEEVAVRDISSFSGGEQKMTILEYIFRSHQSIVLLDEPDNFLDVQKKEHLQELINTSTKTILMISHDREILQSCCRKLLVLEPRTEGTVAWVHGGRYASLAQDRARRHSRELELQRRHDEEEAKLRKLVISLRQAARMSDVMASRYRAAQTRLAKFIEQAPPRYSVLETKPRLRFSGSRTGKVVLRCQEFGFVGLVDPFNLELRFKDRVAVIGANGTGKSHFLKYVSQCMDKNNTSAERMFDGWPTVGTCVLGARVIPGWFSQLDEIPGEEDRTLLEILFRGDKNRPSIQMEQGMALLDRYKMRQVSDTPYRSLSGGQRARFQLLLLELSGANLLLLDEPTDNLDVDSAEALESLIDDFEGTVLAVTHDRWFMRKFSHFLTFSEDGAVRESNNYDWTTSASESE